MAFSLSRAEKVIKQAIKTAGQALLARQKKALVKAYKDQVDLVTDADLEAEKIIITALEKAFPDHNISSEEKGLIDHQSDYTWYIDPLDGTKEYFRQMANYNSSLVLCYKTEPILAAVYIPCLDQLFMGIKNKGAFLNDQLIAVNKNKDLRTSIAYSAPPVYGKISIEELDVAFKKVQALTRQLYRLRYSPNENNSLAYLALGSTEAVVNFVYPTKSIQDFAPGAFIAQLAGAKLTNVQGERLTNEAGQLYIASNAQVHAEILKIINPSHS